MWVKRTEAEVADERRRRRRSRLWAAAAVGAFVMLMCTCLFGRRESDERGRVAVPLDELLSRLPFGIVAGIICSSVFYKWERNSPMMICPQCETTKYEDGVSRCSCGGHYEPMESMKHVS
jgi:hypothetical protein